MSSSFHRWSLFAHLSDPDHPEKVWIQDYSVERETGKKFRNDVSFIGKSHQKSENLSSIDLFPLILVANANKLFS